MCKSREQRLITKEHIATHTNLILPFKPALYSNTYPTGNTMHVTCILPVLRMNV